MDPQLGLCVDLLVHLGASRQLLRVYGLTSFCRETAVP
jgi:hypothetical protein